MSKAVDSRVAGWPSASRWKRRLVCAGAALPGEHPCRLLLVAAHLEHAAGEGEVPREVLVAQPAEQLGAVLGPGQRQARHSGAGEGPAVRRSGPVRRSRSAAKSSSSAVGGRGHRPAPQVEERLHLRWCRSPRRPALQRPAAAGSTSRTAVDLLGGVRVVAAHGFRRSRPGSGRGRRAAAPTRPRGAACPRPGRGGPRPPRGPSPDQLVAQVLVQRGHAVVVEARRPRCRTPACPRPRRTAAGCGPAGAGRRAGRPAAPRRSNLLMATTSAKSSMSIFSSWLAAPNSGVMTYSDTSASSTIAASPWPMPGVSTTTRSGSRPPGRPSIIAGRHSGTSALADSRVPTERKKHLRPRRSRSSGCGRPAAHRRSVAGWGRRRAPRRGPCRPGRCGGDSSSSSVSDDFPDPAGAGDPQHRHRPLGGCGLGELGGQPAAPVSTAVRAAATARSEPPRTAVGVDRGRRRAVALGDDRVDHRPEAHPLAVLGREDPHAVAAPAARSPRGRSRRRHRRRHGRGARPPRRRRSTRYVKYSMWPPW